ncbi:MAG: hypothetical protein P8J91_13665 [Pirellulaceae bacterium]|nr:hypothetical protein [Pirellulaceae bacterium]
MSFSLSHHLRLCRICGRGASKASQRVVWLLLIFTFPASVSAEKPAGVNECQVTAITPLSKAFPKRYRQSFDRYVQVIAPSGKPINIFAQKEISDAQIRHVRDVMVHFLSDFPGSEYGSHKGNIADRMAENHAMIMILKGTDGQYREPRIPAQPLFDTETIVEGTPAYMTNDFERHRDATLEEVLHCVHDNGIGVDVRNAPQGVLPEFQKEIRKATTHAMRAEIWPTASAPEDVADWIEELRDEGSLTQEYLASVIDSYYGLWGPFDEDVGMWGIYVAKTRTDIEAKDPQGYRLMGKFFQPFLSYTAIIDPSMVGTFKMYYDSDSPYTHKSQYLLNAELSGGANANLTGNAQDNRLAGNAGDNVIDGGEGSDTVIFPGPESRYQVTKDAKGNLRVVGDGTDTLVRVENIEFDGAANRAKRFVAPVPANLPRR